MPALLAWSELTTALALFFISHAVPARPRIRSALIGTLGRRTYLAAYSLISLILLGWLIAASAGAPYVELWPREPWQTMVPAIAMPVAVVLAVFALTTPNPLSLARSRSFDARHPGIAGVVRHPILWATLLWSASHLVPNGDVAHVVMFGLFALLSVGGMLALDRRKQRQFGLETWREMTRHTSNIPLLALAKGWRPRPVAGALLRILLGLGIYVLLMATHGLFTGMPVIAL